MACLEMFSSDQHQCSNLSSTPPPMSPRISFSNDFVDTQQQQQQQQQQRTISDSPKVSSNFEFSTLNFNMVQSSADEIFSKGRILPFKQDINKTTTLRDELLNDDEDGDDDSTFSLMSRPPKGPIRWRDFLRLNKRNHILSSKCKSDHHHLSKVSDGGFTMESVIEGNEDEELHVSKMPKEGLKSTADDNIGTNTRENVEIGI